MKLAPAIALLVACGTGVVPAAHAIDDNDRAYGYISSLMAWKLGPHVLMQQCERTHPEGVAARKTFTEAWGRKNIELFRQIDDHARRVLPRLFPDLAAHGADPVDYFDGKAQMELTQDLAYAKPEEILPLCTDYTESRLFNDKVTAKLTEESFAFLTEWEKNNPVAPEAGQP
ncbi:MAG: hypothetical protein ACT4P0_04780 [Panacagrimonas sp.]